MKDKKVLIGIVLLALILIGGGIYMLAGKKADKPAEEQQQVVEEEFIKLTPEEIGLDLEASPNNRKVRFTIAKAEDITNIVFDGVYEDAEGVGQNLYDELEVKPGTKEYQSKYYDLGTCSSGTCRYHEGVESVQFVLRITKKDGKEYEVSDTLEL